METTPKSQLSVSCVFEHFAAGQPMFVVMENGYNEPGHVRAPYAGFVPNYKDALDLKEQQVAWGLKSEVYKYVGYIAIDPENDGQDLRVWLDMKRVDFNPEEELAKSGPGPE